MRLKEFKRILSLNDMTMISVIFAISFLSAWTILEAAHAISERLVPSCPHCGYSLMGVKCPECGKCAGDDQQNGVKNQ